MSTKAEAVFSYLGDEGFRPKYDEDKDIVFKYEGDKFVVMFNENDEDYISVSSYIGLEFDENETLDIYKLANKINFEYIVGKCSIMDREEPVLRLRIDFLGPAPLFLENFERYLTILQQMERDFAEGYRAITDGES